MGSAAMEIGKIYQMTIHTHIGKTKTVLPKGCFIKYLGPAEGGYLFEMLGRTQEQFTMLYPHVKRIEGDDNMAVALYGSRPDARA